MKAGETSPEAAKPLEHPRASAADAAASYFTSERETFTLNGHSSAPGFFEPAVTTTFSLLLTF